MRVRIHGDTAIYCSAVACGSKAVQQRADPRRCSRGRTVNGHQQGVMRPRTSASRGGRPRTTLIVHSSSLCMCAREVVRQHAQPARDSGPGTLCTRRCVATGTSFSLGVAMHAYATGRVLEVNQTPRRHSCIESLSWNDSNTVWRAVLSVSRASQPWGRGCAGPRLLRAA